MASILSNNSQQSQMISNNPIAGINNIINQIMGSINPQQTFNQILSQSPEAQQAMNLINQYGNGNPQQAFMNYMAATGKQNLGQSILQKLGLS